MDYSEILYAIAPIEWDALEKPGVVYLPYETLYDALGEDINRKPCESLIALEKAIPANYANLGKPIIRINDIGDDRKIPISEIREDSIGELIAVDGIIRKITQVKYEMTVGMFKCERCPSKVKILQHGQGLTTPGECYLQQDGCGRVAGKGANGTRFTLLTDESTYRNIQKFEITEAPENLAGGEQPSKLIGYAYDDLAGMLNAGDRVTLTGWLDIDQTKDAKEKRIYDLRLMVNNIKFLNETDECGIMTDEEIKELEITVKSPEHVTKLISSIAPSICGYSDIKEAIALQLFGGVAKITPDGQRIRGDIHIFLIGDPGIAKSQMLRYASKLSNRGAYASGKASSAAGLTAAAVKDEFGEGRFVLEAGVLPMADKGYVSIDEMDKMTEQDRSSMHEAMESQCVTVAKAGIKATLPTRCPVLGAANPKLGRFDPTEPLTSQIDMPPALLSRFDVIFAMSDSVNAERDLEISTHIMRNHMNGRPIGNNDRAPIEPENSEIYNQTLIKRMVRHGRTITPKWTDETAKMVPDQYVNMRKLGERDNKISITPRQSEAYIRLSEASARMRFSETVEKKDVERAIRIVNGYLLKLLGGDVDNAVSTIPTNDRQRIELIKKCISSAEKGTMGHEEIINSMNELNIPRDKVNRLLDQMTDKGILLVPKVGWYKVIE